MIGLSVPFCVKDIVEGKIDIADVEKIIKDTKEMVLGDWMDLCDRYSKLIWRSDPKTSTKILMHLVREGKIVSLKHEGYDGPNIRNGIVWVKTEEEVMARFKKI